MRVVPYTLLDDISEAIVKLRLQNRTPKEIVVTKDELEVLRKEVGHIMRPSYHGDAYHLFDLPVRVEQ